jgi:cell shape-determining protein MreC
MKKTWRRKRSIISIPPFFLIIGGVFFIGWAVVSAVSHLSPGTLEKVFTQTAVVNTAATSATGSILSFFTDKSELAAKIKRLEDNELALQLQLQISAYTQEENVELRNLLRFVPQGSILANVLAWPPKTAYDTLLVEAGEAVSVGDLVLGRGIAPIGLVERTEGRYAYVKLFSQGGLVTQVRAGKERVPLELTGQGGGSAFIVAPKETLVDQGDDIFFPYNGNTFMGHIGAVETNPSSSTKTLWIVFPKHFYAYTWVSIVPHPTL